MRKLLTRNITITALCAVVSIYTLVAYHFGTAKGKTFLLQCAEKICSFDEEFYLGQEVKQEVGILKHIALNYLFPRAKRLLVNVVYCRIEGKSESGLLVVGLLLAKGYEVCNAGVFGVLEVKTKYFFYNVARTEGLGVY